MVLDLRGADVAAKASTGSTALHLAVDNGHDGMARILLDAGGDGCAVWVFGCAAACRCLSAWLRDGWAVSNQTR